MAKRDIPGAAGGPRMGTALPCAWAGAGTLAEYSVVGTGGTSTAAGLACRSHGSASGAARPLLGMRSTGAAAFRDGDES